MFSKTTRCTFLGEAEPDPLVGMSQQVRQSFAEHQVACLLDSSPGAIGPGRELTGQHPHDSGLPVNITLSCDSWGVLLDHGGA